MRQALLLIAPLLFLGCSSEPEKDPITLKCEAVCKLEADHPCASQENDCIQDCRAFGTKAQSFGGPTCGDCVAGSYVYLTDVNGRCLQPGYSRTKSETTRPECFASCVEPDAGTGGI